MSVVTQVIQENGEPLGEWETEHPIRAGDVIVDASGDWKALYFTHVNKGHHSYLVVRRDV